MNIRIRISLRGAALGMLVLPLAATPVFADVIVEHSNVDHSNVDHAAPQGTSNEGDGGPPPIMGPPPPSTSPGLGWDPLSGGPQAPTLSVPGLEIPSTLVIGPSEPALPPVGTASVPEPTTAGLLLAGAGLILRRRRSR